MNAHTDDAGIHAGSYMAMARLFSYPNPATWKSLVEHGLVDAAIDQETLEADYLAAFEIGRNGSAVPLFEGMHRREMGREGILEGLLRFYEFFDIKLSETDREYPDHLVTELEFLSWLCQQEQAAVQSGRDGSPFVRAARDFLDRHLAAWAPAFCQRLGTTDTVYAQYASILEELVESHRRRLGEYLQNSGEIQ